MKTNVKFLIEPETKKVMAYFPNELYNVALYGEKMKTCYVHLGQHSACLEDYAATCKEAKQAQYLDLKKELEKIGYNLNILNPLTRQDILNTFYAFFVDSQQSKQDIDTNYSDLQKMPLNQLKTQYHAFFN